MSIAQSKRVNRGRRVEDLVESVHSQTRFLLHAILHRANPGVRAGRIVTPQGPDFYGMLVESARFVFVEVKGITDGSLYGPRAPLVTGGKARNGHFTQTEVDRLTEAQEHGALCVVLVLHGPVIETARWCPVLWQDVLSHPTRIFSATDLGARAMRPGDEWKYLQMAESREKIR